MASRADRRALKLAVDMCCKADTFLDIGSYTGLFAIVVARRWPQIHSYAYEIVPENFLCLWQNVIRNDVVAKVSPKLLGIGAEVGTVRIKPGFGPGVLASSAALDTTFQEGVEIPILPLDELFESDCGNLVIKVDVEGFEWQVLAGGSELIAKLKPDIICEILRRAPHVPQIEKFLAEHGYSAYRITAEGLVACKRIEAVKHERDWLFTTRTRVAIADLGHVIIDNDSPNE